MVYKLIWELQVVRMQEKGLQMLAFKNYFFKMKIKVPQIGLKKIKVKVMEDWMECVVC